ncbi:hypothetical protein WJX73_008491 [Symbiochloris irregularis]|uniref:Uncharacterized protein n=1 Tax=Symbiochloris irregularis TaxID=706552 RepID=A0AAW1Q0E6_9CHLO
MRQAASSSKCLQEAQRALIPLKEPTSPESDARAMIKLAEAAASSGTSVCRLAYSVQKEAFDRLVQADIRGVRSEPRPDGLVEVFLDRDSTLPHQSLHPYLHFLVFTSLRAAGCEKPFEYLHFCGAPTTDLGDGGGSKGPDACWKPFTHLQGSHSAIGPSVVFEVCICHQGVAQAPRGASGRPPRSFCLDLAARGRRDCRWGGDPLRCGNLMHRRGASCAVHPLGGFLRDAAHVPDCVQATHCEIDLWPVPLSSEGILCVSAAKGRGRDGSAVVQLVPQMWR